MRTNQYTYNISDYLYKCIHYAFILYVREMTCARSLYIPPRPTAAAGIN